MLRRFNNFKFQADEDYAEVNYEHSTAASFFSNDWVANLRISWKLRTNSGLELKAKLFVTMCDKPAVDNITTAEYHPQTEAQAELFNSTILTWLYHYRSAHQKDSKIHLLLPTYAYYVQTKGQVRVFIQFGTRTNSSWTRNRRAETPIIRIGRRHRFASIHKIETYYAPYVATW